ncbi:hypothetical protein J2S28_005645 [Rhizobium sp. SLBN-94]|nr:hypothetical protein [Rhizobium sp. SLBN-94]
MKNLAALSAGTRSFGTQDSRGRWYPVWRRRGISRAADAVTLATIGFCAIECNVCTLDEQPPRVFAAAAACDAKARRYSEGRPAGCANVSLWTAKRIFLAIEIAPDKINAGNEDGELLAAETSYDVDFSEARPQDLRNLN